MKILFVITGLGVGGAERQLVDLADALREQKHEVAIAFLTGEIGTRPKAPDIQLLALDAEKNPGSLLRASFRLKRLVARFQPDVVHSHMFHANLLARLMRWPAKIPRLICSAHSTNEGGPGRMLAYRLTHRLAEVSTNVSHEAVAAFEKKGAVPNGGMQVVRNGIDTDRFRPGLASRQAIRQNGMIGDTEKLVIAVGRLEEAKDLSNLFHAWEELARTRTHIKLWVVGDGELRQQLESLAARLSIAKTVSFLGIRDDIPDLLNAADLFVLSSAWEGFSLVTAEAMACEKVAVVTDSGGVREVLGECGFLVKPRDSHELAMALDRALNLPDEAAVRLGERARQRVIAHFSLARAVGEWLSIYAQKAG